MVAYLFLGVVLLAVLLLLIKSIATVDAALLARLVKEMESDKELSAYTRQLGLAKRRLAQL